MIEPTDNVVNDSIAEYNIIITKSGNKMTFVKRVNKSNTTSNGNLSSDNEFDEITYTIFKRFDDEIKRITSNTNYETNLYRNSYGS